VLVFAGCSGAADHRLQSSIDQLEHAKASAEDEGAYQRLVAALEKSDSQSLKTPTLVNAFFGIAPDNTLTGRLSVQWIASQPGPDGIRIIFSDSSSHDVLFDDDDRYLINEQTGESLVYSASPFVSRDAPAAWTRLKGDDRAAVVLIADGRPISNEQVILRVK
jgi:hypothetical protein